MRWTLTCVLTLIAVLGLRAGDPQELTPLVHPQHVLIAPAVVDPLAGVPVGVGFYRPNRWDVWQNYAVDRTGRWRPRVALASPEPFYLYNGAPYLLLPVRPRDFLPYILD